MGSNIRTNADATEVSEAARLAAAKVGGDLRQTARDARLAAENFTEALRHSAADIADAARKRARSTTRDVRRSVRRRPIAWLGAAAGVGAAVTLLIKGGVR